MNLHQGVTMEQFDITKLSLEDKARLTHGQGQWHTHAVGGLRQIMMTDGPHGLRKQADKNEGINDSERATCFPTASAVASSFSRECAAEIGRAIAEEAIAQGVDVVLGPGINVKRSPLCGRNFEYFSEDPFLAGELAVSYVNAMQSKGVGCCLKHFALNSQETRRMTINAVADERAMREIYLSAFENVVKNARPYAVMASYNKVNGQSATQNVKLYDILRNEWGFDGPVMSDWGACYDMAAAYSAGLDLEMPDGGKFHEDMTIKAVGEGRLFESDLDRACLNVAKLVERCNVKKEEPTPNYFADHNEIARKVAAQSAVLLKNDGILPLKASQKLLVVGELAEKVRYQGAGSSHVNSVARSFLDILTDNGVDFRYAKGYSTTGDEPNDKWESDALALADKYDAVLFFGGLTDDFEGEGYDRTRLEIPQCQQRLLARLYSVNSNIVFVAFGGSPYALTWLDNAKALLNMYLGGQAVMQAAYDLLFGLVSPSGRLAETLPESLIDTPCYNYFANDKYVDEHRESIFVGYRYYNTYGVKPRFPFGYGLSYSKFLYDDLRVTPSKEGFKVRVAIKNAGEMDAYEVVQVYVDNCDCGLLRAKRELRAFTKVFVKAGQTVETELLVPNDAFRVFYEGQWRKAAGDYTLCVCSDVNTVLLHALVSVDGERVNGNDRELYPSYFQPIVGTFSVSEQEFYSLCKQSKQVYSAPRRGEFTLLDTLEDMQSVRLIRRLNGIIRKIAIKQSPTKQLSDPVAQMIYKGARETPLISMPSMGGIPSKYVMFLLHHANKRKGKAFKALLSRS